MRDLDNEYPPAEEPTHGAVSDEIYSYYARIFNAITASPDSPLFTARRDMARRVWGVVEPLLTRVLAPDEATIERLAQALVENSWPGASWEHTDEPARISARDHVKCVLAALAGTSAQARHTDDDEPGGGEHG